jgi:hypothetical protein
MAPMSVVAFSRWALGLLDVGWCAIDLRLGRETFAVDGSMVMIDCCMPTAS